MLPLALLWISDNSNRDQVTWFEGYKVNIVFIPISVVNTLVYNVASYIGVKFCGIKHMKNLNPTVYLAS